MLVALRWGLVPFWAESVAVGRRLALARVESVLAAPAFRHAIRHRRCLIAVDGFYEWQRAGRSRRPFVMRQRDGRPFALGGIWERWKSPTGESIETCAVLTQPARPPVDQVHDRMPLVLSSDAWSAWLDPGVTEEARIATLLRSGDSEWPELVAVAVSSRVNDPRFDEPACFEPESTRQLEVPFPSVAASTATREGLPSRQA
jgi:putative SOS response-associated peptidase YedK